jgi:hypothetical protein
MSLSEPHPAPTGVSRERISAVDMLVIGTTIA